MKKSLTLAAMLSTLSLPATCSCFDFSNFSPSVRVYGVSTSLFRIAADLNYQLTDSVSFSAGPLLSKFSIFNLATQEALPQYSAGASVSVNYYCNINQNFIPYVNINIASLNIKDPTVSVTLRGSVGIDVPLSSKANLLVGYYAEIYKDKDFTGLFYASNAFHGPEVGINFKF
ncbi:hypothetical protein [Wolbachia endosymbiont of Chironomus riparius]|uniref:hypothetical protein n=1 Tax=Wolbachia endosymbiont of Chironomus riparius TaxID=2883238 RepID=UPI00209E7D3D|nr:hypothetical protein [Wolbachia endosymbiont of Chironomus riparius]